MAYNFQFSIIHYQLSKPCPFVPFSSFRCLWFKNDKNKKLVMKRLFSLSVAFLGLFALVLLGTPNKADAQIIKQQSTVSTSNVAKSILSGVDTAYANFSADYSVKSFRAYVTDTSGTVGGKVYFQGSYGDGYWDTLDSLTISATGRATVYKLFNPGPVLIYGTYRFAFLTTGTQVSRISAYYLRRN